MTYPVSEMFDSIQGEGQWAGTRMFFIRLAGCTVGKPFKDTEEGLKYVNPLHIYNECCTTYDGRKFGCDTDFRVKERLTELEIFIRIPSEVRHVCITGGEPMMHNLDPLVRLLAGNNLLVHIETSGTISHSKAFPKGEIFTFFADDPDIGIPPWICVSPKLGVLPEMIKRAHEIKLLIDENFKIDNLPEDIKKHNNVYVQPINSENELNRKNIDLCLGLQKIFPEWILSLQLHKVLGVR